jgi:nicotinate-nucleotide--dimethylbenzimidazole phosphoribosyltransferase
LTDDRSLIAQTAGAIAAVDDDARAAARALQLRLTKPAGALGRLEDLHAWLAGVRRAALPDIGRKLIVVAAGDHGVDGVSAYPAEVTGQMTRNFLAGGAAINVLARQAGAEVRIVDAGIASEIADPRLHVVKVRAGTADMTRGPAMTRTEAEALITRGIAFAGDCCEAGFGAVALGDMGIGNTTAAAAITAVWTGLAPALTVGRGTGVDDQRFARKLRAVEQAIAVHASDPLDGVGVVAAVGGCEIAFLAGVALGCAAASTPVVLDGYPTTAAALIAAAIAPASVEYMLAAHVSAEPGHRFALEHLGLRPLLDLGMRLGEGSGAALALMLLDAAVRLPREMATFESAAVSTAEQETAPEA